MTVRRFFIIHYFDLILVNFDKCRRVLPKVQPGYLAPLIPDSAPLKPETWQEVMSDIERVIMPGVTHWHSPRFHAYFPTANSYPAIVAVIFAFFCFYSDCSVN